MATRSVGDPTWSNLPSAITPTRSASVAASSKSWVTRSVGSSSARRSSRSSARTASRVCASSAESGSSRRRTAGISRERARERHSLPLAAGEVVDARVREVSDAEAVEELLRPRAAPRAEAHVAEGIEVGKERVLLEDVPDAPPLGWHVDAPFRVEHELRTDLHGAGPRREQAGDDAQHRRLPRTGRPDESEGLALADLERYRRSEAA